MQSDSAANSALSPQGSKLATITPASAGESPMDFIQKNLRSNKPVPPTIPAQTASVQENTVSPETAPKVISSEEPKKEDISFVPAVVEIPKSSSPIPPKPGLSIEPDFEGEAEIAPEAQNFRKLRTKYKETSKTLKERDTETESLRTKIKKYEEGEEAPEYVENMKKRLSELEPLEHIHKLKTSDAYKTSIIEPLAEKKASLNNLAKDYEIPEEVVEQASEIKNTKELNQFLLNHFDEVGALEAKQHIVEIQKIKAKATQAENTPKEAISKMEEEHRSLLSIRDSERKNSIAGTAKNAWGNTIRKIVEKGQIQALIPRENDPEFNEKYPYAIQKRAAEDYGRIVRELSDAGLTKLSPELSEALATASILAITSAVAEARATAAEEYASDLERNTQRSNRYSRPNLGASGGGSTPIPQAKGPITTTEAARNLMGNVLASKGR